MNSLLNTDVIFILGPTGSGKSSIAIELAERLTARGQASEIVSADAYQIYRDIPILTAAPSARELARVPHHLIHSIELEQQHDAAEHARMAEKAIIDIQKRGAKPIIVGGSGLYVKFISHGISEAPPSNLELRQELEQWSREKLIEKFGQVDPEGLAVTAIDNKRYLVRNLEIVLASGRKLEEWRQNWGISARGRGWVIQREIEELNARIAKRAGEMVEMGLLEEIRGIEGRALSGTAGKVLGLDLVREVIHGRMSEGDMVERLAIITRQYAKRQRTWLRREEWVRGVELREGESAGGLVRRVWE